VRDRNAEAENAALHGVQQLAEPLLERIARVPLLAADPIGELGDDDGAGVAADLLLFQPGDDSAVALAFRRLA
jgi:hypothetical protein